jgi:hypothetical protein
MCGWYALKCTILPPILRTQMSSSIDTFPCAAARVGLNIAVRVNRKRGGPKRLTCLIMTSSVVPMVLDGPDLWKCTTPQTVLSSAQVTRSMYMPVTRSADAIVQY